MTPAEPQSPPDWNDAPSRVDCPRCGYNLYRLTHSRCPECALDVNWTEVMQTARLRAQHDGRLLFELRWRDRPFASWFATLWFALRPWELWRRARLTDPIGWRTLVAFTLATGVALLVAQVAMFAIQWILVIHSQFSASPVLMFGPHVRRFLPSVLRGNAAYVLRSNLPFIFALCVAMMAYRLTVIRHRIRWHHLVRVVLYAWIGAWTLRLLVIASLWLAEFLWKTWAAPTFVCFPQHVYLAAAFLPTGWLLFSMASGFANFLKLRNAWPAAIAAALLAVTMLLAADVVISLSRGAPLPELSLGEDWFPGLGSVAIRILAF